MEVTTDNFDDIYPEMEQKIKECDFCSIDCELSGITNFKHLNSFDTPKHRYDRMRKNDQNYLILQFGVCFFKCNDSDKSNCYETSAYNCFLFPRSEKCKFSHESSFSCLNSSLEFLINQGFDFNKQFTKGVSFMSKENEEKARNRIMKAIEDKKTPKNLLYPSNNKDTCAQIDSLMKEIDEFVLNAEEAKKEIKFTEFILRIYIEKNIKLKYYQVLKYEYKFLENKERLMTLSKVESKDQKSDLDILEHEIGFSKVIWLLSQSKKLIVGHNMLTDTMQILRQFFSPLPENYDDFKSMTNSLFPNILDTKYMASLSPLKELINNTTLGDMDKILDKEPFPKLTLENCEYSTKNEKLHEAGYDAFLTGYCYLRMLNYLVSFNSSRQNLVDYYSNKIHLMRSFDIQFIDLKNKQDEPKRDNVFYLEFPPAWEAQNIYDLFSSFGSIFIGWIDDTSAFVALQNPENTKKAAGQLVGVSGREFRVYFYTTYLNKNKNLEAKRFSINNGTNEKRKVIEESGKPVKEIDTAEDSATTTPTKSQETNQSLKKIKLEDDSPKEAADKPFQECADWSINLN